LPKIIDEHRKPLARHSALLTARSLAASSARYTTTGDITALRDVDASFGGIRC
jgi:hypothetical protein